VEEKEGRHTLALFLALPPVGSVSPPFLLRCPHHRGAEVPLTEVEEQREPEGNPPSPVSPTACPSTAVCLSLCRTLLASRFTPYRPLFINGEQRSAYAYTHHYASSRIISAIATRRHRRRRHARARVPRGNRALSVALQDAPRVHRQGHRRHRDSIEFQDRVNLSRGKEGRFTSSEDPRDREMRKKPAAGFALR